VTVVSVRYGKNVTDFDISECVTESVSVNPMDKFDGGNAPSLSRAAIQNFHAAAYPKNHLTLSLPFFLAPTASPNHSNGIHEH
jgi:hypothetical protein